MPDHSGKIGNKGEMMLKSLMLIIVTVLKHIWLKCKLPTVTYCLQTSLISFLYSCFKIPVQSAHLSPITNVILEWATVERIHCRLNPDWLKQLLVIHDLDCTTDEWAPGSQNERDAKRMATRNSNGIPILESTCWIQSKSDGRHTVMFDVGISSVVGFRGVHTTSFWLGVR